MNLHILVDSLTLDEMNEVSNIIYERKMSIARSSMKPLTDNEKLLVKSGQWINAIKAYRERNVTSLLEAKVAIDAFRGQ